MSITSGPPLGRKSDKSASPFTASDAKHASLQEDLYTYIIWTTAASAAKTCELTYCPCALIAIGESLRYIVAIEEGDCDELLMSTFDIMNELG